MAEKLPGVIIPLSLTGEKQVIGKLNSVQRIVGRLQRSILAFAAVILTRQLVQGVSAAVKSMGDLDRAMQNISATSKIAGKELFGLRQDFLELSTQMAGSVQDFAKAGLEAARAGLRTREEILALTVAAARFGKVSEISFQQSAKDLVGLSRAFGATDVRENIGDISDAIIVAAENFAVSQAQIIEGLQRVTAATAALNLSIPKTVTFIAAITEKIGRARKAGTELNSALFKSTKNFKEFANIVDLSEDELKKVISQDALGGLILLLGKLQELNPADRLIALDKVVGLVGAKATSVLIPSLEEFLKKIELVEDGTRDGASTLERYQVIMQATGERLALVSATFESFTQEALLGMEREIRNSIEAFRLIIEIMRIGQGQFSIIGGSVELVSNSMFGWAIILKSVSIELNRVFKLFRLIANPAATFKDLNDITEKTADLYKQLGDVIEEFEVKRIENSQRQLLAEEALAGIREQNTKRLLALNEIAGTGLGAIGTGTLETDTEKFIRAEEEKLAKLREMREAFRSHDMASQFANIQAQNEAFDFFFQNQKNAFTTLATVFQSLTDTMQAGVADIFKSMIRGTLDASQAFKELGLKMIDVVIDYIAQIIIAQTIGRALAAAGIQLAAAQAATLSAIWAPPATLASIATGGGAAAAGIAAVQGAVAASAGIAAQAAAVSAVFKTPTSTAFQGGKIPQLAEGGIVRKPTLAMVGESGPEAVVPLDKNNGTMGTLIFNFNDPTFFDDDSSQDKFVRRIEDALVRATGRRTGGTPIVL